MSRKNLILICAVVVATANSAACVSEHRVKTHPDPELRIERMRETLKSFGSAKNASEKPTTNTRGDSHEAKQQGTAE